MISLRPLKVRPGQDPGGRRPRKLGMPRLVGTLPKPRASAPARSISDVGHARLRSGFDLAQKDPEVFLLAKCFWGGLGCQGPNHYFIGDVWLLGLGTPGLQQSNWPSNHFGILLIYGKYQYGFNGVSIGF
jgi:hypothetical protein